MYSALLDTNFSLFFFIFNFVAKYTPLQPNVVPRRWSPGHLIVIIYATCFISPQACH